MSLQLVPKPAGFELRDKRSEKTNDASKWLPADALFSAHQAMQGDMRPAKALIVAWFFLDAEGEQRMTFRLFNETDNDGIALVARIPSRLVP